MNRLTLHEQSVPNILLEKELLRMAKVTTLLLAFWGNFGRRPKFPHGLWSFLFDILNRKIMFATIVK